jgi:flagellar basal body rod protein FlgG
MPYTGNDGSMTVNENGQLVRAEGYSKKVRRNDPIKKLFTTNQKVCKYKKVENKKLLRILERIELDKPILMHDKLDIIWDKNT